MATVPTSAPSSKTLAALSLRHETQEVGEGLTLDGNRQSEAGGSDQLDVERSERVSGGARKQGNSQRHFSKQHLERIKQENKVSALLGQNVILNCAVQFKDGIEKPFVVNWLKYPEQLPLYIWYAGYPAHVGQGYENRVSRIGQASLNLTQVRETDQGLYECKIYYLDRRPEDKSNGTWIFLDVQGRLIPGCKRGFTESKLSLSSNSSLLFSCLVLEATLFWPA